VSGISIRRRVVAFTIVAATAAGAIAAVGLLSAAWSTGSARGDNSPGSSAASGTTPACSTSHLAVWIGVGAGGGAAGSTYYPLEFTNRSSQSCHLYGFPGVSATANGRQAGSAAQRNHLAPERSIVLAPGASAHALLQITDVANFDRTACRPVTAAGLVVYPPNQTASAFIPFRFAACAARGPAFLSVGPVQARVGIPGA
jgi:Protein of unknown function (DUF4232)